MFQLMLRVAEYSLFLQSASPPYGWTLALLFTQHSLFYHILYKKKVNVCKKNNLKAVCESILFTALLSLDDLGLYERFFSLRACRVLRGTFNHVRAAEQSALKDCMRGGEPSLKSILHSAFTWLHKTDISDTSCIQQCVRVIRGS